VVLAPLLQVSLMEGRESQASMQHHQAYGPPGARAALQPQRAVRAPTQAGSPPLLASASQLEAREKILLFRGHIFHSRPAERSEISAISDLPGHGRSDDESYLGGGGGGGGGGSGGGSPLGSFVGSGFAGSSDSLESASALFPPTTIPARFHVLAPDGRRLFPSERPIGREEAEQLERTYDALLAEAAGDLPAELQARDLVLAELGRQVHPHMAERAALIERLRDLYSEHTRGALALLSRVDAADVALAERREQLGALRAERAVRLATHARLEAQVLKLKADKLLRAAAGAGGADDDGGAAGASVRVHDASALEVVHEFERVCSAADRLQLLSQILERLPPAEQVAVLSRALDRLPASHVDALVAERLEALHPPELAELLVDSLRAAAWSATDVEAGGAGAPAAATEPAGAAGGADGGAAGGAAGGARPSLLATLLAQLSARKTMELTHKLVVAWGEDAGQFAVDLFAQLNDQDRLGVCARARRARRDTERERARERARER
jgi:hypothetical protein